MMSTIKGKFIWPGIVLQFLVIQIWAQTQPLKLWYEQPAVKWTEALPIGNGRIGAMIFGGVGQDRIQFNEETLWTGEPRDYNRPGAGQYLDTIRRLLFEGKQKEAEQLAGDKFMGMRSNEGSKIDWVKNMRALKGMKGDPSLEKYNDSSWKTMPVPSYDGWEAVRFEGLDGAVWFRRYFNLPVDWFYKNLVLDLGRIRDHDFTYVNGYLVGTMESTENRKYVVPSKYLKPGLNSIAIQVLNYFDKGGIAGYRDTTNTINLYPEGSNEFGRISLKGNWKYFIQNDEPPAVPRYQADYQPFGDLWLDFENSDNATNYQRDLDITNAIASTSYTINGINYKREYFSSQPAQLVVVRVSADKADAVSFVARLSSPHKYSSVKKINNNTIALSLKVKAGALRGESYLQVNAIHGKVEVQGDKIIIKQADEVVLYLSAGTNYKNYKDISGDPVAICRKSLQNTVGKTFQQIKDAHVKEYQSYFNTLSFNLGRSENEKLPTDVRIKQFATSSDPAFVALYLQYGRYLLISASRPGTRPANLQGIWNDLLAPPWGSKYTTNINLEMNYWPAELLNLSPMAEPLFTMIGELAESGKGTARTYYNSPGWVLHHNTDLWRGTAPINASNHGIWVSGGAWLCHHLWEHYLFTQDKIFLRDRAYPLMKKAALFFNSFLIKDPKTGWLISTPSNSPEQGGLVAGPTMDHQIIRDLFKNVMEASEILGIDKPLAETLKVKYQKIAPNQVGKYGQLQEWMQDKDDTSNRHRHVSHLWGLYPGSEINYDETPKLVEAAKQSLIYRGDAATGWSLGWKINFWARFKDGDHSFRLIQMLLSPAGNAAGSYPNLFDAHPPFQIDGNFGGSAGIGELLLQSHTKYIDLLPALPSAWPEGEIKGIKARGGFELTIKWKNGKLENAEILSTAGNPCLLKYGSIVKEFSTEKGKRYIFNGKMEITGITIHGQKLKVKNLRCEYLVDPIGIETKKPRFSWELVAAYQGVLQKSYRILVADDPAILEKNEGNILDTKNIRSSQSIQVEYNGKELLPAKRYYWKVMVWDNKSNASGWSSPAQWQMGLPEFKDWNGANWIGYESIQDSLKIVPFAHGRGKREWGTRKDILPLFRKGFGINKSVKQATVFICGLGQFELSINGKKTGDHFLDPGWTQYNKHTLYVGFDITQQLKEGQNAIGVMLGNGFYYIPGERYRKLTGGYGYPKMIAKVFIDYKDGSQDVITSNASWKTTPSPTIYSSTYGGEDYDASLEQAGWNKPGFDDRQWKNAVMTDGPPVLQAQLNEPVKIMQTFAGTNRKQLNDNTWVYDLSQNFSGIPSITVNGSKGDTVRVTPGELIKEDGSANQGGTGGPYYYNYILKGEQDEQWSPRFTYYGFRYLQVQCIPKVAGGKQPAIIRLEGLHIRNGANDAGEFVSSNELFNQINKLIQWAIKSNTVSVSTDCPHREKLGWLEQTHLMGNSIQFNYDVATLFRKTIDDMINAQTAEGMVPNIAPEYVQFEDPFRDSPEWGSAAILLPWYVYKWYGDKQVINDAWNMMKKYITYLQKRSQQHILSFGLGDWYDLGPNRPGFSQLTPMGLTATAMFYYDLDIMSQIAKLLGKTEETKAYAGIAKEVKQAFNAKFFDNKTKQYGSGSQTANAMALYLNLVEPVNRKAVLANLVKDIRDRNNALTAGDIGYRYVLQALEQAGRSDVIFDMNSRVDVPGYGYQLAHGATSLTESWQALPSVSNNHLMLGHLMEWFYSGLCGINQDPNSIAFEKIQIKPQLVGNISSASASYHSIHGWIKCQWERKGINLELNVTIPANTTAVIYFPPNDKYEKPLQVGSGNYFYVVKLN